MSYTNLPPVPSCENYETGPGRWILDPVQVEAPRPLDFWFRQKVMEPQLTDEHKPCNTLSGIQIDRSQYLAQSCNPQQLNRVVYCEDMRGGIVSQNQIRDIVEAQPCCGGTWQTNNNKYHYQNVSQALQRAGYNPETCGKPVWDNHSVAVANKIFSYRTHPPSDAGVPYYTS